MRVEAIRAWPHRVESVVLELPEGSTVADALAASGFDGLTPTQPTAVHGVMADAGVVLREGDRVEVLRPLLLDPKEARRRRARR
ncbi:MULTISPECIES: RnfH family protein [unclassified Pseudoxanthomonas]|uniref:RnfH family protein n=1 Tax=unclassified Pseudoxanthomonas TaxID=2645906 RepID=UPI000B81C2A3|nr:MULTISPECIES: RnfH family protein [unclassified Pseudoxanthomonas]PPJ44113.1 RnfH family protein [Pseudoxanthomonas sp. KAs_5_3]